LSGLPGAPLAPFPRSFLKFPPGISLLTHNSVHPYTTGDRPPFSSILRLTKFIGAFRGNSPSATTSQIDGQYNR
jgi:hypothetical protein